MNRSSHTQNTQRTAAPVALFSTSAATPVEHRAWVNWLNSAEGRGFIQQERLTQAELDAAREGRDYGATGWLDRLKKKALKAAFKSLPTSWQKKIKDWAERGTNYFKSKWDSLPGWVKKTLTLGGAISVKTVIEWLIDILL
ncbi:hypothetical protein [Streptomyces chartreusis]|uniref:hypothetical protein n=1 Tax=Streptomyces chartreusis TaxID=1969 RepID=UPI00362801CE